MLGATAAAQNATNTITDFIEVLGYADQDVTPDIANLTIVIDESDPYTKSKGAKKMEELLIKDIEDLGLDSKQLTLKTVSSSFAKRKNIEIRNVYSLKVTDVSLLADLIDTLKESGISNVYIRGYEISDKEERVLQLKVEAIENAKIKAQTISTAAQRELGELAQAVDQESSYTLRDNMLVANTAALKGSSNETEAVSLEIEKITISASIKTIWRLK